MLFGRVLLLLGIPALVILAVFRLRSGVDRTRVWVEVAFGFYLLCLVDVVLFPLRVDPGLRADDAVWDYAAFIKNWVNLTPFATIGQLLDRPSGTQAIRQLGGNLVLLVPLGLALPVLFGRMRSPVAALATIVLTAFGIEGVQFLARVARLSLRSIDVDDAILNVIGGLLGFVAWVAWNRVAPRLRSDST